MQGIGKRDSTFRRVFHPEMDGGLHVHLFDVPAAVAVRVRLVHELRHERTGYAVSREREGVFEELQLVSVRV